MFTFLNNSSKQELVGRVKKKSSDLKENQEKVF